MNHRRPISLWQALHHVALQTDDVEATAHFYRELLGMAATSIYNDQEGRLCLVKAEVGNGWGIHFLESPHASTAPPVSLTDMSCPFAPHIALQIENEAAAIFLRSRLLANHIMVSAIAEWEAMRRFLFRDNNGHLLEVMWQHREG